MIYEDCDNILEMVDDNGVVVTVHGECYRNDKGERVTQIVGGDTAVEIIPQEL